MKKITKVIATLACMAALAAGACIGFAGCSSSSSVNQSDLLGTDEFDRTYTAASEVTGLTGVKEIKVYWYAKGTVTVKPSSDGTVSFKETGADGLSEDELMHYTNNNDTLVIRSAQLNFDDTKITYEKSLTIYIPTGTVDYLEINATHSTVEVDDAFADAVANAKASDK